MVEANALPTHKTKVSVVVPTAAVAVAVTEDSHYCQKAKLSGKGSH